MEITPSKIKYIIAISELYNETKGVKSCDVAAFLLVAKPSVNKMMQKLCDDNIITKSKYKSVFFSKSGKIVANEYYNMFCYLKHILKENNVDDNITLDSALNIVSVIDINILKILFK